MSDANLLVVIWGLMAASVLVGAGLGWWYGTATFYLRAIGEAYVPVQMRRGLRVKRHLARIFWMLLGAVGGSIAAVALLMALARG